MHRDDGKFVESISDTFPSQELINENVCIAKMWELRPTKMLLTSWLFEHEILCSKHSLKLGW